MCNSKWETPCINTVLTSFFYEKEPLSGFPSQPGPPPGFPAQLVQTGPSSNPVHEISIGPVSQGAQIFDKFAWKKLHVVIYSLCTINPVRTLWTLWTGGSPVTIPDVPDSYLSKKMISEKIKIIIAYWGYSFHSLIIFYISKHPGFFWI